MACLLASSVTRSAERIFCIVSLSHDWRARGKTTAVWCEKDGGGMLHCIHLRDEGREVFLLPGNVSAVERCSVPLRW